MSRETISVTNTKKIYRVCESSPLSFVLLKPIYTPRLLSRKYLRRDNTEFITRMIPSNVAIMVKLSILRTHLPSASTHCRQCFPKKLPLPAVLALAAVGSSASLRRSGPQWSDIVAPISIEAENLALPTAIKTVIILFCRWNNRLMMFSICVFFLPSNRFFLCNRLCRSTGPCHREINAGSIFVAVCKLRPV